VPHCDRRMDRHLLTVNAMLWYQFSARSCIQCAKLCLFCNWCWRCSMSVSNAYYFSRYHIDAYKQHIHVLSTATAPNHQHHDNSPHTVCYIYITTFRSTPHPCSASCAFKLGVPPFGKRILPLARSRLAVPFRAYCLFLLLLFCCFMTLDLLLSDMSTRM